jgi:23S rRNA (cytidine1920-2'-O)/16S rRNA (cytidine1409-2'-O)-methyltransferase
VRRLDALLVERGLAENRSRARALILAGAVRVGEEVATRAGAAVDPGAEIRVTSPRRYVSRAGEKLAGALEGFGISVTGRDCLDAGASTGGFTDVLLQRGARRVVAVDVGYGQLDWRLRNDPRVTVMERTNVRYLTGGELPLAPELLVADLSFISLAVALERLVKTTPSIREAVVLVKPQFEAGPQEVRRGGVVRDPEVHFRVISEVVDQFDKMGFGAAGVMRAAVAGRRSGNREYPLHLLRGAPAGLREDEIREAVET